MTDSLAALIAQVQADTELIQRVSRASDPTDRDLLDRSSAITRVMAAAPVLAAALKDALEVIEGRAKDGLRADLTPTMHFHDMDTLYADFVRYLRRLDASVRDEARSFLVRHKEET